MSLFSGTYSIFDIAHPEVHIQAIKQARTRFTSVSVKTVNQVTYV